MSNQLLLNPIACLKEVDHLGCFIIKAIIIPRPTSCSSGLAIHTTMHLITIVNFKGFELKSLKYLVGL